MVFYVNDSGVKQIGYSRKDIEMLQAVSRETDRKIGRWQKKMRKCRCLLDDKFRRLEDVTESLGGTFTVTYGIDYGARVTILLAGRKETYDIDEESYLAAVEMIAEEENRQLSRSSLVREFETRHGIPSISENQPN